MVATTVKPYDLLTRIPLHILLIVTIVLSGWLPDTIFSAHAQSPLEQQRQKPRTPRAGAPALAGRVVSVQNNVIYTSITTNWPSAGITDGTVLRIQLGGRNLDARFLSSTHYSQVLADPAARKSLDVDLVCTLDRAGALAVVGLAGGLPEWLGVKSGSPVTVVKQ
jgi:hypothetical protein